MNLHSLPFQLVQSLFVRTFNGLSKRRHNSLRILLICCLGIGGCAQLKKTTLQAENIDSELQTAASSESTQPTEQHTHLTDKPETKSALTPELLYQLLVSDIASQRNNLEVAADELANAAFQSNNETLLGQAAQLSVQAGRFKQAIRLLEQLEQFHPDNIRVKLALINAQFGSEKIDEAFERTIQVINQQTTDTDTVLYAIAELFARQESFDPIEQFSFYEASVEHSANYNFVMAVLASQLEKKSVFREHIDRTLTLIPDWESAAMLKLSDQGTQSIEQAHEFANDYLSANPKAEKFRVEYGRLLFDEDDKSLALKQFNKVLGQSPYNEEALFLTGLLYLNQDEPEKAKRNLEQYLILNPDNDQTRLFLADIAIDEEKFDEAIRLLSHIYSAQFYIDAQITLSAVIENRDGVEDAIHFLDSIDTQTQEERIRILLEKDALYRKHDMLIESKQVLDEGLEEFPQEPDLLYNRGLLAVQLNLLELHEQDMRLLIESNPNNAHAYNALGYTLADQTDRLSEAYELIQTALELRPEDPFILDSMGWVHFRLGELEEAIEYLQKAMSSRADAEIAAHLGEALWVNGQQKEARAIWKEGIKLNPDNSTLLDTIERLSSQPEQSSIVNSFRFAKAF